MLRSLVILLRLRVRLPFARFSLRFYVKVPPATPPRLVLLEVLVPTRLCLCVQGKLLMQPYEKVKREAPTATHCETLRIPSDACGGSGTARLRFDENPCRRALILRSQTRWQAPFVRFTKV